MERKVKWRRYLFICELRLREFATGLREYVTPNGVLILIGLSGLFLMYLLLTAISKTNALMEIYIWSCNGGIV